VGGFNWTKAGKQKSTRRYGVEVEYDTDHRRKFMAEATERQAKRSGPKKRSRKMNKRSGRGASSGGGRKVSGAVRPGTIILCIACNAEVKNSEFERHRVERHGYTAGVYVRASRTPQPANSRGQRVTGRVGRALVVPVPVKAMPPPPKPKKAPPVQSPVELQAATTSPARSTPRPIGPPGPGWVRCDKCSTWVKHLARHDKRVHNSRRSRTTVRPKRRPGNSDKRPRAWCSFCGIYVVSFDEHRKNRCRGSPLERAEAKAKVARAQLEQVRRDIALLSRPGRPKAAGSAKPASDFVRGGARALRSESRGSRPGEIGGDERHVRLATSRLVRSSAHCWKCGERLFESGTCSNRNCMTLIVDE
jgi:hypothetical protein